MKIYKRVSMSGKCIATRGTPLRRVTSCVLLLSGVWSASGYAAVSVAAPASAGTSDATVVDATKQGTHSNARPTTPSSASARSQDIAGIQSDRPITNARQAHELFERVKRENDSTTAQRQSASRLAESVTSPRSTVAPIPKHVDPVRVANSSAHGEHPMVRPVTGNTAVARGQDVVDTMPSRPSASRKPAHDAYERVKRESLSVSSDPQPATRAPLFAVWPRNTPAFVPTHDEPVRIANAGASPNTSPPSALRERTPDTAEPVSMPIQRVQAVRLDAPVPAALPVLIDAPVHLLALKAGESLEIQVMQWAKAAGWTVSWNTPEDWVVPAASVFGSDFQVAVTEVVNQMQQNGADVKADIWTGNKTVVIDKFGAE